MTILLPTQVAQYAADAGFSGVALAKMTAIAFAESSYNTNARNPSSGAVGLWQILPSAHPEFDGWKLTDPAVNARAAYQVYKSAPNPGEITRNKWSAYKGVTYYAVLPAATAAAAAAKTPVVGDVAGVVDGAAEKAQDAASGAWDAAKAVPRFLDSLSDPRTWLRIAYGVAGIALVVVGVLMLARPVIQPAVSGATKVAKTAATKGAA